jgi:uncharacterized membrane protein
VGRNHEPVTENAYTRLGQPILTQPFAPLRQFWRPAARKVRLMEPAEASEREDDAHEFVGTVVVQRPRHQVYAFWRDFCNLPKFMRNVTRVTAVDALSSVWTVTDAEGKSAEWEFLITDDEEDRLIAWSTSGHTPVHYSGRVEFKTLNGDATEVTATLRYAAPSGLVESLIAKVAGTDETQPLVQTPEDLARFKSYMESETARADTSSPPAP